MERGPKMRSLAPVLALVSVLTLMGCSTGTQRLSLPRIEAVYEQSIALRDLADLHARATAVAVVRATGKSRIGEFVAVEGVLPTPFPIVEVEVLQTIKGKLPNTIELREGYTYPDSQGNEVPVVSGPAQFLLYVEPYSLGDGSPWNGQWVTTGWLSGVFMDLGVDSGAFTRVDREATVLPAELTVSEARNPAGVKSDVPAP